MRIVIDTDGTSDNTQISFNGQKQELVKDFHLSIHAGKKVKVQMIREIEGAMIPISLYADDFKKYDEFNPIKKGEN